MGAKSRHLLKLQSLPLEVPEFIVLESAVLDSSSFHQLVEDFVRTFPDERFIVRSDVRTEDTPESSMAGHFLSIGDLAAADLPDAIERVFTDAKQHVQPDKIAVILQRYISAEMSGVVFTRNPLGGREMVVEFSKGGDFQRSSGSRSLKRICLYTSEQLPAFFLGLDNVARIIESHFSVPMDIEWCISGNQLYILQARHISTLSKAVFEQILFLESHLPKKTSYFFEKTELTESVNRPTPLTRSLLERIYASDGPVHRAYKRLGISYQPESFFVLIGNELYVDKEKELWTLLPSYSYLSSKDYRQKLFRLRGIGVTIHNLFSQYRLRKHLDIDVLDKKLRQHDPVSNDSLETSLARFLESYESIFEANLFCKALYHTFKHSLSSAQTSKLSSYLYLDQKPSVEFATHDLCGNSLEIADESPFQLSNMEDMDASSLEPLSRSQESTLHDLRRLLILREKGRMKTVRLLEDLRLSLRHQLGVTDLGDAYFSSIDELLTNTPPPDLADRKTQYEKLCSIESPSILRDRYIPPKHTQTSQSLSPGKVRGLLVSKDQLSSTDGDVILYTSSFGPDIFPMLDRVSGIIAEHGGLLSHVAIVAREKRIPVCLRPEGFDSAWMGKNVLLDVAPDHATISL